jgi:hypothetical protein
LNWIGHVNRKDIKRKVSKASNNNPQGSRLKGRPKTDGVIVHKQILISAKLQIGKRGQKRNLDGISPLRRRRPALDCSAI